MQHMALGASMRIKYHRPLQVFQATGNSPSFLLPCNYESQSNITIGTTEITSMTKVGQAHHFILSLHFKYEFPISTKNVLSPNFLVNSALTVDRKCFLCYKKRGEHNDECLLASDSRSNRECWGLWAIEKYRLLSKGASKYSAPADGSLGGLFGGATSSMFWGKENG